MGVAEGLATALVSRLPSVIEVEVRETHQTELALPEEIELTHRMVEKRKLEFLAGRSAARVLLRRLGLPDAPILVAPDRAPIWPEGVLGSISHTHGWCVVLAARSTGLTGLGVDVEGEGRVRAEVERLIVTPEEKADYAPGGGDWRTPIFGIKEAVYKAINPGTGLRPGFKDVRVRLGDDERFEAEVRVEGGADLVVPGVWFRQEGLVLSVAYLTP
jgi:4'-phosphopantetheinyl transferase EntD